MFVVCFSPYATCDHFPLLLRIAMDTEVVDYTNEEFSLGQLHDPNLVLFLTRPRISSSESSQDMRAANFFVSVNVTQFVVQKIYMSLMSSREETNCFRLRVQTIHKKWELPIPS